MNLFRNFIIKKLFFKFQQDYSASKNTTGSVKNYEDGQVRVVEEEKSFCLNYESGDNNSHNNEDGYDVVDFRQGYQVDDISLSYYCVDQSEFNQFYNSKEQRQVTSLDDTTSSDTNFEPAPDFDAHEAPEKPARSSLNRGTLYRSFKSTLHSSFRKGKEFIRNEQGRIVKLFEPKPGSGEHLAAPSRIFFGLDEYKRHYNDKNAEKVYDYWRAKLTCAESHTSLHERHILDLVNQITTQRTIKKQLKTALSVCRSSKEFESSAELIEAERLLLVSNLKEAAAKKELLELENIEQYANVQRSTENFGTVCFTDFEFPLRDAALYDTLYNYFYVVVCTYKDQIKSSFAKERSGSKVIFQNFEIKFWEVQPDYQIKVEVFVLCLRKINHGATNESRLQSMKNISKMSPKRLFGTPPKPTKVPSYESEFSQFISQGFIHITSASFQSFNGKINGDYPASENPTDLPYYSSTNFSQYLKRSGNHYIHCIEDFRGFRMTQMAYNSHLMGQMIMGIKSEVIFDCVDITGFLTVGERVQGAITWNRR